jgi:hypothetical protein
VPTLRHRLLALIGAVAVMATVSLIGGVAQAQTGSGYPPGTSTTLAECTAGNANAGNVAVGQTITFTLCGDFTAGQLVTIKVNGAVALTKLPNGAVVVVITVVSQTVLQVSDPVNVAAVCGTNNVNATGGGTPGAASGTFNLACAAASTASGGLAFTGANIALGVIIALALISVGVLLRILSNRRHSI